MEYECEQMMEKMLMNLLGFSQSLRNRLSDDVERSGVLFVLNMKRCFVAAAVC
jgi:hypothetical protein